MTSEIRQPQYTAPPGATDLYLIRHGESAAAIKGRMFPMKDGHGDPALHETGHEQARAVAARLIDTTFAALYVTKLQRTHQTAAPLAQAQILTPIEDPDLHEVFLGDWEGGEFRFRTAAGDPAIAKMRDTGDWSSLPGGEPTEALLARVDRALKRLHQAHRNERIAAVVHSGIIGAIFALATGCKPLTFAQSDNGSISRVYLTDEGIRIKSFNQNSHL